ncbi:unnamed protein product, partial [Staurois parvus]
QDPAFTISGLPQTLHSLYLFSHRPYIHYIWSPTVHIIWKCNYFSKYKRLNTFSCQQYIAVL